MNAAHALEDAHITAAARLAQSLARDQRQVAAAAAALERVKETYAILPGAIQAKCTVANGLGIFHRHRLVVAHPGIGVSTHKYTREHSVDHELVEHFRVEDLVSFEKKSMAFTLGVQGHGAGVSSMRFRIAESEDTDTFELLMCTLEALAAHTVAPADAPLEAAAERESSSGEELGVIAPAHGGADAKVPSGGSGAPSAGAALPRRAAAPDCAFALQAWLSGVHVSPLQQCIQQRAVVLPGVDRAAFVDALRSAAGSVAAGGDDTTLASDTVVEAASLLFSDIAAAAALLSGSASPPGVSAGGDATAGGDGTVSVADVAAALSVLCQGGDHATQPVFDAFTTEGASRMAQADMVRYLKSALPLLGWPLIAGGDISSRAAAIAASVCAGADPNAPPGGAAGISQVAFASWLADERRSALGAALVTVRKESAALKKLVATQQKMSATLAASAFTAQKASTLLQAALDEATDSHREMRAHVAVLLAKIAKNSPPAPSTADARRETYDVEINAADVGMSIAAKKSGGLRRIVVKRAKAQSEVEAQGVVEGDIIVAANGEGGVAGIVAALKSKARPLRLTMRRTAGTATVVPPEKEAPAHSGELAALAADLAVERATRVLAEAKAAEALALAGGAAEEARQATAACEAHDAALIIARATLAERDVELAAALERTTPLTTPSVAAATGEWDGGPPRDAPSDAPADAPSNTPTALPASAASVSSPTPPSSPAWKALVGGIAGLDAQIEKQSATRTAVQDNLVRTYKALEARNAALEARVAELEADHAVAEAESTQHAEKYFAEARVSAKTKAAMAEQHVAHQEAYTALEVRSAAHENRVAELVVDRSAAKAEAMEHAEKYFAEARASANAKAAMEEQHLKLSGALELRDAALADAESELRRAARREGTLTQQHADDLRRMTLRHDASLPSLRATLVTCAVTDSALEELSVELHETSKNSRHGAERLALLDEVDSALFAERLLFHRIFGDKRVQVAVDR